MIGKLLIDTLTPLNIPISFQRYSGNVETYITFHEYFLGGEEFEDDEEAYTSHYIQIDLWSKSDYTNLVKDIKDLLKVAGFNRLNEIDLYEEETKIYHKGLKFYYLEGSDENA